MKSHGVSITVKETSIWNDESLIFQSVQRILYYCVEDELIFFTLEPPTSDPPPYDPKNNHAENLYCIDGQGKLIWRRKISEGEEEYYPAVNFIDAPKGKVRFVDFEGFEFEVDCKTFEVQCVDWSN